MIRLVVLVMVVLAKALFRSRVELLAENLALRQHRGARYGGSMVPPGFQIVLAMDFQSEASRASSDFKGGARTHSTDGAREWLGSTRIHGELIKLGIVIDERTVSRYLRKHRPAPDRLRHWLAFLRNHRDALVGMDFFTVPTVTFGRLWIFVVLHHERRRILHFAVTDRPQAPWIVQQLREAFPFDTAPRYAILDRDGKYGQAVPVALQNLGVKPVRTAPRCPWQNPYVERFGGTLRRELLDKIIVFNEKQLQRLVHEFVTFYHEDRCHLGLEKDTPDPRVVTPQPSPSARVVALRRMGGLPHRYEWRAAA